MTCTVAIKGNIFTADNIIFTPYMYIYWIVSVLRLWYGLWHVDMRSPIDFISEYHQERVTQGNLTASVFFLM